MNKVIIEALSSNKSSYIRTRYQYLLKGGHLIGFNSTRYYYYTFAVGYSKKERDEKSIRFSPFISTDNYACSLY